MISLLEKLLAEDKMDMFKPMSPEEHEKNKTEEIKIILASEDEGKMLPFIEDWLEDQSIWKLKDIYLKIVAPEREVDYLDAVAGYIENNFTLFDLKEFVKNYILNEK